MANVAQQTEAARLDAELAAYSGPRGERIHVTLLGETEIVVALKTWNGAVLAQLIVDPAAKTDPAKAVKALQKEVAKKDRAFRFRKANLEGRS